MEAPKDKNIVYFAETDFRGKRTPFGIKLEDRARHVYVIGKTGMGKSTLLENMAIQDIQAGRGIAFMDPHGSTAEKLLDYVPLERINDVIYFAPFDLEHPISFNVMEDVGKDQRHLVANGLLSAFKKIWVDAWSGRMEYILNNTLLALLEYPGSTLLGVNRMMADKEYRLKVVANITDPTIKAFWTDEFAKYTDKFATEATAAIQNKIGQFTSNPLIRNIIGQPQSSVNFRQIMDEKKILIINLSKGQLGEGNANLIGSMLVTKLYLTAMSRANLSAREQKMLPPFYLFVDEFQSFANESFANILSEARKYKLALTIAHQYIEQVPEEVRAAVFGNVGTLVSFRVGPLDAELLEKVFSPSFMIEDLVNLGFAQTYLTLMIDGVGSPPFSAKTLGPIPLLQESARDEVIKRTRETFAKPRADVEEDIKQWHAPMSRAPAPARPSTPAPASRPPVQSAPISRPSTPPPARPAPTTIRAAVPLPPPTPPTPRAPTPPVKQGEPVSLQTLQASPRAKSKASEDPRVKDDLRRSLAAALAKPATPKPAPTPVKSPQTPPVPPPQTQTQAPSVPPPPPPIKEVPRDVLEKLLKV